MRVPTGSKTICRAEFDKAMLTLGFSAADAAEMWGTFDNDGSGEVVYHELLAVLQPSMASKAGGHSAVASDPNNREGRWRYNKHDAEDAAKLIERNDARDTPYEEMEEIRRRQKNPTFR